MIVDPCRSRHNAMQTLKYKTATFRNDILFPAEYVLAIEELLEIYIDDTPFSITMRLPGDDTHLVAGLCFTEGIIDSWDDLLSIEHCKANQDERRIFVRLKEGLHSGVSTHLERNAYLSKSSCGLCGKTSGEEICMDMRPVESFTQILLKDIFALKEVFEERQAIFPLTGSTHTASIFGREQELLAISEDVGRHNALDKAIGRLLRNGQTSEALLSIISSRLSFEMVQKAGMLGLEILCGLSGPTGMAVHMAERLNITLIGFLRESSLTIYTHPERILSS
jgi:FdhD protein